jgi:hypothetical protein
MTIFKNKRKTKTQYSQTLLHYCEQRDHAKADKQYYYTTKDSSISFTCNCGEKHTKKFQTIYNYGGMRCKKCTTKEKTKKTLIQMESSGFKRITKDSITQFFKDNNITVTKINSTIISNIETDIPTNIKRMDIIESKCNQCSSIFTKLLRRLLDIKDAICYKCSRQNINK